MGAQGCTREGAPSPHMGGAGAPQAGGIFFPLKYSEQTSFYGVFLVLSPPPPPPSHVGFNYFFFFFFKYESPVISKISTVGTPSPQDRTLQLTEGEVGALALGRLQPHSSLGPISTAKHRSTLTTASLAWSFPCQWWPIPLGDCRQPNGRAMGLVLHGERMSDPWPVSMLGAP